jgi:hypothetical protein
MAALDDFRPVLARQLGRLGNEIHHHLEGFAWRVGGPPGDFVQQAAIRGMANTGYDGNRRDADCPRQVLIGQHRQTAAGSASAQDHHSIERRQVPDCLQRREKTVDRCRPFERRRDLKDLGDARLLEATQLCGDVGPPGGARGVYDRKPTNVRRRRQARLGVEEAVCAQAGADSVDVFGQKRGADSGI